MELKGTVAIVTGGGTGVGRAVALSLARAGSKAVVVNYSRSRKEAEATAEEVAEAGGEGFPIAADVSDDAAVRAMVTETASRFGRLDVLVNCAGITRFIPFSDLEALTDEVWQSILGVNLMGAFYASRAAAPHLKKTRGAIVNIASVAGLRSGGSSLPYGVSKAALTQLTRSLALALAPEVRVNCVNPGLIATRWFREGIGEEAAESLERKSAETSPLRAVVTPEHVAQVVMGFIQSDMVTGEHLVVDAGKFGTY